VSSKKVAWASAVLLLGACVVDPGPEDGPGTASVDDLGAAPDLATPRDLAYRPQGGSGGGGFPTPSPDPIDFAGVDLTTPAPHDAAFVPPPPAMINSGGGVIANPEIWTVAWEDNRAEGEAAHAFLSWMLTSDYWTGSLAAYGIGPGVAKGLIVLPGNAPYADTSAAIVDQLAQEPEHAAGPSTIYALMRNPFVPAAGDHWSTAAGHVLLEVGDSFFPEVLSHEAAEAATDPTPFTTMGWFLDPANPNWDAEIGDLCGSSAQISPPDGGAPTNVERLYVHTAGMPDNVDPCLPSTEPGTYFGVAPRTPEISLSASGGVFYLDAFALGDVGPIDFSFYQLGTSQAYGLVPSTTQLLPGETAVVHQTYALQPSQPGYVQGFNGGWVVVATSQQLGVTRRRIFILRP
jgi:hypothetical protein